MVKKKKKYARLGVTSAMKTQKQGAKLEKKVEGGGSRKREDSVVKGGREKKLFSLRGSGTDIS